MEGNRPTTEPQRSVHLTDLHTIEKRAAVTTVVAGVATAVATVALGILGAVFQAHHMHPKTVANLITAATVVGIGGALLTTIPAAIYGLTKWEISDHPEASAMHAQKPQVDTLQAESGASKKGYEEFFTLNKLPQPPISESDKEIHHYLSDLEYAVDRLQELTSYNWHFCTTLEVMHAFFDDYDRQLETALENVEPYLEKEGVKEEAQRVQKEIQSLQRGSQFLRKRNEKAYTAFRDYYAEEGMYKPSDW